MASQEEEHQRKVSVGTVFATLGRKKKNKDKIRPHGSCANLNTIVRDNSRPDSGFDDTFISHKMQSTLVVHAKKKSFQEDFDDTELIEKCMKIIDELIRTEVNYISDLNKIDSFYAYVDKSKKVPKPMGIVKLPAGLEGGKDRMVFGNARDLLDFHERMILPELQKVRGVADVHILANLFVQRKDLFKQKYGKYCANLPRGAFIVDEFESYFELVKLHLDEETSLRDLLMCPMQRVTRYNLLLSEATKLIRKIDQQLLEFMRKAYEDSQEICTCANDMMYAGRVVGFPGEITRQGPLLAREEVTCSKRSRQKFLRQAKDRKCILFVFREAVVVCDNKATTLSKPNSMPKISYWTSYKMNRVTVIDKKDSTFELEAEEAIPIVVRCKDEEAKNKCASLISNQREELSRLAIGLSNPQAF